MFPLSRAAAAAGIARRACRLQSAAMRPLVRSLHPPSRPVRCSSSSTRRLALASATLSGLLLTSSLLLAPAASEDDDQRSPHPPPSSALPTTDPHPHSPSRPFTSSPLFPHPSRPHISIATADSLPLLVDRRGERGQSVLVEVYSPYCHACERLAPVLDQVAYVLNHLPASDLTASPATPAAPPASSPASPFLVAVLDDSRNHRPGFLTPDEERYLPVMKFFPPAASTTADPPPGITYRGPHNALSILAFINTHLPPTQQFTHSPAYQALVAATSPAALAAVTAAFRTQRSDQLAKEPTVLLFDHSPCGTHMAAMMEEMILRSYRAGVEGTEGEVRRREVVERFQKCVAAKRKETDAYWKSILDIAKQQLKEDDDDEDKEQDEGEETKKVQGDGQKTTQKEKQKL